MEQLQNKLNSIYSNFFKILKIDKSTGLKKDTNKRFASKLAIGENYSRAEKKLLFVSLDIGKDELYEQNTFQDFEHRSKSVCAIGNLQDKNPHMAGVYGTALYFLKEKYNWQSSWDLLEGKNQFFREILIANKDILPQEVLSYITLINFYSFVTVERIERTGDSDRVFVNEKVELENLINIINAIAPDIIIVQSKSLRNYFKNIIQSKLSNKTEIFIGYHPSVFGRGIKNRIPKNYIKNLLETGKI